jgi:hypothetical protein
LKDGVFLVCPNNKSSAAAKKPRKGKKKVEEKEVVVCDFSKRIGDAPTAQAEVVA